MNWPETPKKLLNRVLLLSVFTLLLIPQIAFASWWNPVSWFNHWTFYKTETAPQAQAETPKTSEEITELQKKIDELKNYISSGTTPAEPAIQAQQDDLIAKQKAEEQARLDALLKADVLTGVRLASPSGKPCISPITYSIDKLDSRFNISQSELQSALAEAELIWEKGAGRDLFLYSPQGALPVSLVYDYRQETIDSINRGKSSLEAPSTQQKSYADQIAALRASYDSIVSRHNTDVEYWNSAGGAPSDEHARLESEQSILNLLQKNLNEIVDLANSNASRINASAKEINSSISQLGAYEGGLYVRTKSGATSITVFQFDSHEELVRTLAHEMGHALGVEHSDDKNSFMYSRTADQPLRLTTGDVKAIATICK